jgi:hypothetical protein
MAFLRRTSWVSAQPIWRAKDRGRSNSVADSRTATSATTAFAVSHLGSAQLGALACWTCRCSASPFFLRKANRSARASFSASRASPLTAKPELAMRFQASPTSFAKSATSRCHRHAQRPRPGVSWRTNSVCAHQIWSVDAGTGLRVSVNAASKTATPARRTAFAVSRRDSVLPTSRARRTWSCCAIPTQASSLALER